MRIVEPPRSFSLTEMPPSARPEPFSPRRRLSRTGKWNYRGADALLALSPSLSSLTCYVKKR